MQGMKLWLLEILACPLDHAYPFECVIFRWAQHEKGKDLVKACIEGYRQGTVNPDQTKSPVNFMDAENTILLNDDLVIKPVPFPDYLSTLAMKIKELDVVHDQSTWAGEEALTIIRGEIAQQIDNGIARLKKAPDAIQQHALLEELMPSLEFLNYVKYRMEIEDAVLKCPQCKRWYPVYETIPQLLPDGLRNKMHDAEFSEKWASKFHFGKLN